MPTEDDYIREVIRTVADMNRQVIETRQELMRAVLPLYPRIIELDRTREQDAKDRIARQHELDAKIAQQNAVASQQGEAIQQVTKAVAAQGAILEQQSDVLARIHRGQFIERIVIAIFMLVLIVFYGIWQLVLR